MTRPFGKHAFLALFYAQNTSEIQSKREIQPCNTSQRKIQLLAEKITKNFLLPMAVVFGIILFGWRAAGSKRIFFHVVSLITTDTHIAVKKSIVC